MDPQNQRSRIVQLLQSYTCKLPLGSVALLRWWLLQTDEPSNKLFSFLRYAGLRLKNMFPKL